MVSIWLEIQVTVENEWDGDGYSMSALHPRDAVHFVRVRLRPRTPAHAPALRRPEHLPRAARAKGRTGQSPVSQDAQAQTPSKRS